MPGHKNHYETLEVGKNAFPDEIKKAYKRLARLYHPDTNPGDHTLDEKFKAVNEANTVLSDPQKRKEYDYALANPGKSTVIQLANSEVNDILNNWDNFKF